MRRVTDPKLVHEVWGSASIHPFVVDDFSAVNPLPEWAANPLVHCLMPEDNSAYFMFCPLRFTMFEVHGAVLTNARGRSVEMGREALAYMKANTICRTVLSFVPKGNYPALALDRALGFKRVGVIENCSPVGGRFRSMTLMAKEI